MGLRPDLIVANSLAQQDVVQRYREAGIEVFDLGPMHGLATLRPNIVSVATLLGRPERGRALARRFERRMENIARHIPEHERPSAIYLGIHGDKLYGGTRGSSYHDILTHAGLRDAAAERYEGWPRYTSEQLLALDPDIVVTQSDMGKVVCRHPGLDRLRVCSGSGRIVEIDGGLLGDPSLTILEATDAVFEAVHLRDDASASR